MKKDFIVRRTITENDGITFLSTYSEEELIRCKDCKSYKRHKYYNQCMKGQKTHGDNFYCADGER